MNLLKIQNGRLEVETIEFEFPRIIPDGIRRVALRGPAPKGGNIAQTSSVILPAYSLNEDAEGTGTPSGWVDVGPGVNWDYTTTILEGAGSFRVFIE